MKLHLIPIDLVRSPDGLRLGVQPGIGHLHVLLERTSRRRTQDWTMVDVNKRPLRGTLSTFMDSFGFSVVGQIESVHAFILAMALKEVEVIDVR